MDAYTTGALEVGPGKFVEYEEGSVVSSVALPIPTYVENFLSCEPLGRLACCKSNANLFLLPFSPTHSTSITAEN